MQPPVPPQQFSVATWQPSAPARWLLLEGRHIQDERTFFRALCQRLRESGIPVARMGCGMPTLHPQVHAVTWTWSDLDEEAMPINRPHGIEAAPQYRNSPIALVDAGAAFVRRRLHGPGKQLDFPILQELAATGFTDYLAYPLSSEGLGHYALTFATRAPQGFVDEALTGLFDLEPPLSLVLQLHAARRMATSLLGTYLGRTAGSRVLEGHVLRGDSEIIDAVVWYCDLRDFTAMSDERPRDELVATLNDYFAAVGEPIEREGGEVLKFVGDAVLAVFRVGGRFPRREEACAAALAAADEAFARVRQWNEARFRQRDGARALRFGVALHVGEIFFGNVGTPARLDFTVIGPAVNLASRLAELCKTTGEALLLSEAFVAHGNRPVRDLGAHGIRGLKDDQRIFAPVGP